MFRTHLHNFKRQISIVLLSYPIQNTPLLSIYSQNLIFSKAWDRAGQDPSQEEERGPSSSHPRSSWWSPSPMRSGWSVFRTFSNFFWFTKKWEVGGRGQQTNLILYLASLRLIPHFKGVLQMGHSRRQRGETKQGANQYREFTSTQKEEWWRNLTLSEPPGCSRNELIAGAAVSPRLESGCPSHSQRDGHFTHY